jgi:non-ribosomal peptide synthetase component F
MTKRVNTFLDIFNEVVKNNFDSVAIVFENTQITYSQLDNISEKFSYLIKESVNKIGESNLKDNVIIPIILDDSLKTIVSILSIWKASYAFTVINMDLPKSRINYIIKDCNAKFIIDDLIYDKFIQNIAISNEVKNEKIDLDDLAFVVYTSSSTGNPKGVIHTHRTVSYIAENVSNLSVVPYDLRDKGFLLLSLSFIGGLIELFKYLSSGITIFLSNENMNSNLYDMINYFKKNEITRSYFPVSLLSQYLKVGDGILKEISTSGEILYNLPESKTKILGRYGLSEACALTSGVYDPNKKSVGFPVGNTKIYC